MERMLESEEAARRLGVKVSTLYAYVSRGLLTSYPAPAGRRRLFDVEAVERLARRSRETRPTETRMATITTSVTQLTELGPCYRGRPAVELADSGSFEAAAEVLWGYPGTGAAPERRTPVSPADGRTASARPTTPDDDAWTPLDLGRAPATFSSLDRLRWAILCAGVSDPLRSDARPERVVRTARRLVATAVHVLDVVEGADPPRGMTAPPTAAAGDDRSRVVGAESRPLAAKLSARLSPRPTAAIVRGVDAALVLLADHELATSTMAVRMAASTRADVYDALLAGLSTLAGPLHGGASPNAYALIDTARRNGVRRAVDDTLRWQGRLHGFGHTVYRDGDARFHALWPRFLDVASAEDRRTVEELVDLAAREDLPFPNVDLGLAAFTWAARMPPEAGQVLFTVARLVGWVAHYLEELDELPLRYRARAVYATPRPTRPGGGKVPG